MPELRRLDEDDPPIVRRPHPFDQAVLGHSVDDPGRVRQGDVEELGDPAHRHRAVLLELPEDVNLGHADALLHELLGRGAAKFPERPADIGQDRPDQVVAGLTEVRMT